MHLPLLATLLSFLTVISANPVERLRANVHVTTLGEGATQPGPILPRGSIIPLEPADHFPSELEIVQSVNAYSMLLVCHFFRQGSFCDSPLNNVDEFLAFTGHLHNVLDCQFKPGGKKCATNENPYLQFDFELFIDRSTLYAIDSKLPIDCNVPYSFGLFSPESHVDVGDPTFDNDLVIAGAPFEFYIFDDCDVFVNFHLPAHMDIPLHCDFTVNIDCPCAFEPFLDSFDVAVNLNSVVEIDSRRDSGPFLDSSYFAVKFDCHCAFLPSVPSSTHFINENLMMKRTVQRAGDTERKPLAQEKAAQPDQLNGTAAAPGNDSTSDTSLSFERKGALPGIITNAAANAITTTVQDAVAEDEQEHAKNESEGKDKELKIIRGNTIASGNVTDVVFGVVGAMGVAQ
ncbi:hypothetical protein G7Y79_00008g023060 [Physcia stellaris]|nr:hypothetical protein G7Y79_00008g023060 [Physcia stellaris]